MKRLALCFVLMVVVGCQKHDDSNTSASTSSTASASSASTSATASATPLATIDPMTTASAAPTAMPTTLARDAGANAAEIQRLALQKQNEDMQLKMLGALGNGSSVQDVLKGNDPSQVDFAAIVGDAGNGLRVGSGGPLRPGHGGGGGLAGIGARDH